MTESVAETAPLLDEKEHRPMSDFGLCIDGTEVFISAWDGVSSWTSPGAGVTRIEDRNPAALPPAVLAPRVDGEPIRADLGWPPHPRGIGDTWPPEACVEDNEPPGRFPLAYAWPMLSADALWTWREGAASVKPAEAIAAVTAEVCGAGQRVTCALVVPNVLSLMAQQRLIDECRRLGIAVKLLWRPVAAVMKWCETSVQILDQHGFADDGPAKVLVLHLGIENCETTWLEVIRHEYDGQVFYVPARRRPKLQSTTSHNLGRSFVHRWAVEQARKNAPGREPPAADVWNTLWGSTELWQSLQEAYQGTANSSVLARLAEVARDSAATRLLDLVSAEMDICRGWGQPAGHASDVATWWQQSRQLVTGERFIGAIATGPLAAIRLSDSATLGAAIIGELSGMFHDVLVEGLDVHRGFQADTAAAYLTRLAAGVPAYMDSLPSLRTAAYVRGEPQWVSLLTDEFCPGGHSWHRPQRLTNLEIRQNRDRLKLVVDHEEYETGRTAIASLAECTQQAVPVELDISIEPAAGNARIRVVPVEADSLGGRDVFVEWERMTETQDERTGDGLTADEWLKRQPTLFPQIMPRKSSPFMWDYSAAKAFRNCIDMFKNRFASDSDLQERLADLAKILRQKDTFMNIQGSFEKSATALDSDGKSPIASELPERFSELATARLQNAVPRLRNQLLRALAAASTPCPLCQDYLTEQVRFRGAQLDRYELSAIGWCLRDPQAIGAFARIMAAKFRVDQKSPNNWLKALGEVLRYRADATKEIPSGECEALTRTLLTILERSRSRRMIYKNAVLCVTYLLRRRREDDGFLIPDGRVAQAIKREFAKSLEHGAAGGGAIPLADLLKLAIDFIDRKGPDILSASRILRQAMGEADE